MRREARRRLASASPRFAPSRWVPAVAMVAVAALGGCSVFEDLTPENIYFQMRGDEGDQVQVIYSTQFVAGIGEFGVTRVQVLRADTIVHVIPFDRTIDISVDRRWFVQAESMDGDTLAVQVFVNVDDRGLVNESGGIFPDEPWHFVYSFNQLLTRDIDVQF